MNPEDLEQVASERVVDLTKAISGLEGRKIQSIAFKIYNARKEAWEKARQKKHEGGKKPIHSELQHHLEEFLERKREEKKIDIEQLQKFRSTELFPRKAPAVDLSKIDDQINIQRGLGSDIAQLKNMFQEVTTDSDID